MSSWVRTRHLVLVLAAFGSLLVSACGTDSTKADDAATSGGDAAASTWTELRLTDVSGETFVISDLAGRPVFVENFATWCSNCLRQLGDTQKAAAAAGDSAVFLALSVETDLDAATVADYAEKNGFADIRFAVMTPDFLAAMSDAFGTTALNPPSTPKVLVDASGAPGEMVTGFESPSEIGAKVAATT